MKVQIEKTFPMPASSEVAWALLQDIEAVAGCMPGAAITERTQAGHYKGTVALKVGPASMLFRGQVEVKEVDAATRTLRLLGKGTDSTGTSGASMDLTARIEAGATGAPNACDLVGVSEVSMSGKAATFGGRMMGALADQVLKQFAANFAARAQAMQAQAEQVPLAAQAPAGAYAAAPSGVATVNLPVPAKAISGLALLWAIWTDWLRGLFRPPTK
jgi:carbon monoxide dehydrogenase subunit G